MKGFCTRSIFLITTLLIDALNSCSTSLNSHEDESNVTRVHGSLTGVLDQWLGTTGLFSGTLIDIEFPEGALKKAKTERIDCLKDPMVPFSFVLLCIFKKCLTRLIFSYFFRLTSRHNMRLLLIVNTYSLRWRCLEVNIYLATSQLEKWPLLATELPLTAYTYSFYRLTLTTRTQNPKENRT